MRPQYIHLAVSGYAHRPVLGIVDTMNSTRKIAKITVIADRCTVSGACVYSCPEVFHILETCVVLRDGAREHYVKRREAIEEAADGCPLEAIQVEYEDGTRLVPLSTLTKGR
jgi:ferredoxin